MLGLAFSGGKDALACWYLTREQAPVVLWVNTGKSYPETRALIDEVRAEATRFIEIRSDQAAQNAAFGLPADLVPVDATAEGMLTAGRSKVMVQPYLQCCRDNLWLPLMRAVRAAGITTLIRGQRADDAYKSPVTHGMRVDGVLLLHPVETWTAAQVLDYIKSVRGSLPDHFSLEHSSLDCYDCTAYVAHSADRVAWMSKHHPDLYRRYAKRRRTLCHTLAPWMEQHHV